VIFHGNGIPSALDEDRMARADFILAAPESDLLTLTAATVAIPEPASIRVSAVCALCGEPVMESKLLERTGRRLCIPCAAREKKDPVT
jgi:formylmethanofuran dehydrogenase subunit E